MPTGDPEAAVLVDPQVPEERRVCANPACGAPVGRRRDGHAGLTDGFCARCGTPYSFRPRLAAGDLVGGQYEVVGCLAYGGLGWIHLARDRNVSDKWVVLKGVLSTHDPDARAPRRSRNAASSPRSTTPTSCASSTSSSTATRRTS